MKSIITVPTNYYQQYDADNNLAVPGKGYGGWKKAELKLNIEHTAIVIMHAWDNGSPEQYPGWYRACEYVLRASEISKTIFPKLLSTVRAAGIKLYHVAGCGNYHKEYPGYKKTIELAGECHEYYEKIESDPVLDELNKFRQEYGHPGKHNLDDIYRGFRDTDFLNEAKPHNGEGIAENAGQLHALCKKDKINHLIYSGFCIDGCMLMSPGGMMDMAKRGFLCSVIREAVTAIENKETAEAELCKDIALWRVALLFGFVYGIDDFINAIITD